MQKSLNDIQEMFTKGYLGVDITYLGQIEGKGAQLNQINKILAVVRANAIDEETHFHGAAIVKTSDGKFYIDVNKQTGEAIERNCSERRAIDNALGTDRNSTISDVWFMGGVGYLEKTHEAIAEGKEGERNYPCGSCIQHINNYKNPETGTEIHILPLNDGSWDVFYANSDRSESDSLRPEEVVTRSIDKLFPYKEMQMDDKEGYIVNIMQQGLAYYTDSLAGEEIAREDRINILGELKAGYNTKSPDFFAKINRFMSEELKRVCSRDVDKIRSAAVAIVRREDGEFFVGNNTHSFIQSSTPSSVFTAISNATMGYHNPKITDVWKLKVDFENLPQQLQNFKAQRVIKLPTLRGDELERVKKFSTLDDNGLPNAEVTIIPVNNKQSAEVVGVVTISISSLLPTGFKNPKQERLSVIPRQR